MVAAKVLHKEKAHAPELRFKGFDDNWETKTLFDISEKVSYGMNAAATLYDGIHKYIRITDIDVNSGEFKPDPLTSPLGQIDEKFKLKKGDIVFARTGASVGKSHLYNPKDGALYFAGFLIKFSVTKADPFFIYSLTLKEAYNKWVHIYSMRSGQPGLNAEEYKALKLNIPSRAEQQKIASFLAAVDKKIQQLTRKKDLLVQCKKGMMQQLFAGKLRFKDENGNTFPRWEEKKIKDFVLDKKGAMKIGPFGSQLKKTTFVADGFKVYGQENIFLGDFDFGDRYITETHFNALKTNELHPGDFVISTMGTIGKCCLVAQSIKRGIMDSHMIRLQLNQTKILPTLLSQVFISYLVQKQVKRFSVGGIMDGLSMGIINKLKFTIPVDIQEQQKVADYLSKFDDKIENLNKQISLTLNFKKGLLQQMFV